MSASGALQPIISFLLVDLHHAARLVLVAVNPAFVSLSPDEILID